MEGKNLAKVILSRACEQLYTKIGYGESIWIYDICLLRIGGLFSDSRTKPATLRLRTRDELESVLP